MSCHIFSFFGDPRLTRFEDVYDEVQKWEAVLYFLMNFIDVLSVFFDSLRVPQSRNVNEFERLLHFALLRDSVYIYLFR